MSIMQRLVFSNCGADLAVGDWRRRLAATQQFARPFQLLAGQHHAQPERDQSQPARALDEQRIVLHKAMLETHTAKLTTLEAEEHKAAAMMKAALDEYEKHDF